VLKDGTNERGAITPAIKQSLKTWDADKIYAKKILVTPEMK
jgi:hypothetical protein